MKRRESLRSTGRGLSHMTFPGSRLGSTRSSVLPILRKDNPNPYYVAYLVLFYFFIQQVERSTPQLSPLPLQAPFSSSSTCVCGSPRAHTAFRTSERVNGRMGECPSTHSVHQAHVKNSHCLPTSTTMHLKRTCTIGKKRPKGCPGKRRDRLEEWRQQISLLSRR
jgi:hypothetical protein